MRIPRFRFTIRLMMMAVLIAALSMAAIARMQHLRAKRYYHKSAYWAHQGRVEGLIIDDALKKGLPMVCGVSVSANMGPRMTDEEYERSLESSYGRGSEICRHYRLERYHLAQLKKYAYAVRYPWLPVAADGPLPD